MTHLSEKANGKHRTELLPSLFIYSLNLCDSVATKNIGWRIFHRSNLAYPVSFTQTEGNGWLFCLVVTSVTLESNNRQAYRIPASFSLCFTRKVFAWIFQTHGMRNRHGKLLICYSDQSFPLDWAASFRILKRLN